MGLNARTQIPRLSLSSNQPSGLEHNVQINSFDPTQRQGGVTKNRPLGS